MKTWLNSHWLLVVGAVFLLTILISAGEEIVWIIRDDHGKKWPRAGKQLTKTVAYILMLMLMTGFGLMLKIVLIGWDWELKILAALFLCAGGIALMGFVILPLIDGKRKV